MENDLHAVHLLIGGKVQGVGFRYYVLQSVRDMNIHGWVRNLADGRVEVLAEGSREDLEEFIVRVGRGPRVSQVGKVESNWEIAIGQMSKFQIVPSAPSPR